MLREPKNEKPVDQIVIRGDIVSYHHLLTHPPHYGNLLINSLSMPFHSSRFCVFVKGED